MALLIDSILYDELAQDPTTPEEGQKWYNTTDKRLKVFADGVTEIIPFGSDIDGYAIRAIENQRWIDSTQQRQDIRDVLDGYIDELEIEGLENQTTAIQLSLDGYALKSVEDQRWIDSTQQRQDIRDVLDGYIDELEIVALENQTTEIQLSLDGYALESVEDQRWIDSTQQRQDIRDALDAYVLQSDFDVLNSQTTVIQNSLDGYIDELEIVALENQITAIQLSLDGYALKAVEDQRWIDSTQQRQDIRDVLDGYIDELEIVDLENQTTAIQNSLDGYALEIVENQRWIDSTQQRQDIRDALDGYALQSDFDDLDGQVTVIQNSLDGYTTTDETVKVSANDTTAGFLNGKLIAGTNVTLVENNDGGNETFTISANDAGIDDQVEDILQALDGYVKNLVGSTDHAIARYDGYSGKIIENTGITINDNDVLTVPVTGGNALLIVNPVTDMVMIEGMTNANDHILTIKQTNFSGEFVECVNPSENKVIELRSAPSGSGIFRVHDGSENNYFEVEAGQVSIDSTNTGLDISAETDYCLTIRGPADASGIFLKCGDDAGTAALHIEDSDGTFQIWHLDADNGKLGINTITPSYGIDNQYTGSSGLEDFNTQNGVYRVGGIPLRTWHLDDVDTLTVPPGTGEHLSWDGANWVPSGTIHYGNLASDPVSPAPSDGYGYYNTALEMEMQYDATRGKWLSVESVMFQVGRSGNTAPGSYYRGINGLALSSTRGYTALYNGTVVGFGYTRSDSDAATFDIVAGGSSVATLASSAVKGKSNSLNGDFSEDDVLAVTNQAGGNTTSNVAAWIKVKWRA